MIKTAVVILNWNGRGLLEQFLPSVAAHSIDKDVKIYVADNNSTDDSVAFVKKNFPQVELITLDKNYGFARGYTMALAQIEAHYYILLNSDVEVTAGWMRPLINLMDADGRIAACMPKIKAVNDKNAFEYAGASGGFMDSLGYTFCRGRVFEHIEEDKGQYDTMMEIFWASGACLCVRADAYKASGGLDPIFYAHMEEIDLCWRLQNMGYKIMVCPSSVVYHVGGASLPKDNPLKTYLNFRNNLYMLVRNLTLKDMLQILPVRLCLDMLAAVYFSLRGNPSSFIAVMKAHLVFFFKFPKVLMTRPRIKRKPLRDIAGVYPQSITSQFFIRKKKTYKELNTLLQNS